MPGMPHPSVGRVPLLLHAFPTFAVGGAQTRLVAIANHFGRRYRHLIVAMDGDTACAARLAPQVDFDLLPMVVPKRRSFGNALMLRRTLSRLRPDLLVTYNWGSIEWGLANMVPLCRHLHIEDGFGSEEAAGQLRRRVWFRRMVLAPRAHVVLPSRLLYRISTEVWRLPRQRLHYLPNGIDCERFAGPPDAGICAALRRHPGELLVGTVAALRAEKNLGRLVEAFARLNRDRVAPARLVIVGDGAERPRLEALAASLGLGDSVVFTGTLAAPERVLGTFDVFALSSDTEQMPYSVLEAMAAGLAVAAVAVGDVRDMVAPENRPLVVEPRAEALAGAMATLLSDRHGRKAIGEANARHVRRHYRDDQMFKRYGQLFDGIPETPPVDTEKGRAP